MSSRRMLRALAIAALPLGAAVSDAAAAALPADPCALLEPSEIQALAPGAAIPRGTADKSMAPLGVGCTYSWGPGSPEWGDTTLTVTVLDMAQASPGVSADLIRQGMLAMARASGPNASEVPGVGDVAVFTFEDRVSSATTQAYFAAQGIQLAVKFHAGDSLAGKDTVIALLKRAASRL